jgi:hypothetical protein
VNKNFWIFIVCVLTVPLTACRNVSEPSTDKQSKTQVNTGGVSKITAPEAITKANQAIGNSEWKLAFVSNTGVAGGSVMSKDMNSPKEGLMDADGKAGQWVLEYFKDPPMTISEGGRTGKKYSLRRILVTAGKTSESPEAEIGVPEKLVALGQGNLDGLDAARKLATSQVKVKFDVASVGSNTKSNGETTWTFRFYDLKSGDVVENITTSGDGKKRL